MKTTGFLAIVLALSACNDPYSSAIDRVPGGWRIHGTLVYQDSHVAIPDTEIEVVRVQRKCRFCEMGSVVFVTTKTDSNGRFEISSEVPGSYSIAAWSKKNSMCVAQKNLYFLSGQDLAIDLKMPETNCYMKM